VSRVDFSTVGDIPAERIKILRAVELLNSGYHTEALLVAFALLDNYVQQAIEDLLKEKAVHEPRVFSGLVREARMATFLDPVLKSLVRRSLKEDKPHVWQGLESFNRDRNRAMHDSTDIPYENAKRGIETTRDILLYLESIRGTAAAAPESAPLRDLRIDKLPFLFHY
jgi:hypothetical protein